jgi:hypothetical protein
LVKQAVEASLNSGARTGDLARLGEPVMTTREMGEVICRRVAASKGEVLKAI